MNIIPVINHLITSFFIATENFLEKPVEFGELEKSLDRIHKNSSAECMVQILEEANRFICDDPRRKKEYTIQRHDPRTLITTFGDVTYTRTLFRSRKDGSYHYLLDERMHLPKDEHFSERAEVVALQEATEHTYQAAADRLAIGMQTVSRTAIMNKVHGIVDELPEEEEVEQKQCRYLYIEADEDHISRQETGKEEKHGIIGKLIYLFEGKEELCAGKRKLIAPVYFGGIYAGSQANGELWDRVQAYIKDHYDQSVLKTVYICSDGGGWIKAATEHIDKSVAVADRFHLMKYINAASRLALDDEEQVKRKFYKNIYKNRKKKIEKLLLKLRWSTDRPGAVEACEGFLMNNWEAIQRAFHDKHCYGCSAESHVSHIYSKRMSTDPMAWSERGADCMCRLRCLTRTYGKEKIVDLVRIRRERATKKVQATGTDGPIVETEEVRRKYTKAELEAASYAERMHATLSNTLVLKELSIRTQMWI